jgi:hypothetical protein
MLPGSGNRPRYTPRREPETPRGYGRREYEGERGQRGRGFADVLTVPFLWYASFYPYSPSSRGYDVHYSTPLRCSSGRNNDPLPCQ